PAAQASPGVARRTGVGTVQRRGLPAVPAGGPEAVPEGLALLHGQVRDRAPQLPAGAAWAGPIQAGGLWPAAPREAEGQTYLRAPRGAVPALLRPGGGPEGRDGGEPLASPRAAPGQCRLPAGLRRIPRRSAPDGGARPLPGQRPPRGGAFVP